MHIYAIVYIIDRLIISNIIFDLGQWMENTISFIFSPHEQNTLCVVRLCLDTTKLYYLNYFRIIIPL